MIITYLRSSSYGTHQQCSHRYMMEYVMGLKSPSNKKANLGTIVHKAMEVLAREKKARQEGQTSYDDESFGLVQLADITPEWATRMAYNYYVQTDEFLDCDWKKGDVDQCIEWTNAIISINKGLFDPRNRHVLEPEQRFDFTIDKPWARYEYDVNGVKVEGQLGLKGTMDLVVQNGPGLIEVIDYKTGQRADFAKNWKLPFNASVKKSYQDLRYDPQLCLYHYASCHLFPDADEIFMTIIYINDGGPFTLCFDRSDIEITERIIRSKFEQIRDTQRPILNRSFKCGKMCYFGKTMSSEEPSKTLCEFYRDKANKMGIDRVVDKYGKTGAFAKYGDGGGRKEGNSI